MLSHDWSYETQPLAYQIGRSTCWVTSIINGIMCLRNGERIGYLQYRTMQSALNSFLRSGKEGKCEGVWFETDEEFGVYENVIRFLGTLFSLRIRTTNGAEVTANKPFLPSSDMSTDSAAGSRNGKPARGVAQ